MDIRSAIIQRITDRFMRFRAAFDRFDDASAEREKVGPNWNVRDLAAHLAHWTAASANRIPELSHGAPPNSYDFEKINDNVYRKNRRMSFVMLLPQLRQAEENVLAALRTVRENQLLGDTPVREHIDKCLIDHYDHHWPGLRAACENL